MKREQFNALMRGDLVRHVVTGKSFVVIDSNGLGRVTVARTIDAMNPFEWEKLPDVDDPSFVKPETVDDVLDNFVDKVRNASQHATEPEAALTMNEPASTPDVGHWSPIPVDPFSGERLPASASTSASPSPTEGPVESRTTTTISQTTTTNPAEPLARLILQSASNSASPADVRRVANVLEHVASAARNDRSTADVFRDAHKRLADLGQPVFRPASAVPQGFGVELERAVDVSTFADAEQRHKVVGRFVDGRFVATENSTPVARDALDRLNDELDELELERALTGNTTTTTSTTTTTEPAVILGRRAFDALRGPFYATATPTERNATAFDEVRRLPSGDLVRLRFFEHFRRAACLRSNVSDEPVRVPADVWRVAPTLRTFVEFSFDASAVIPLGPERFFLNDVRQLSDGRFYSFRNVLHYRDSETLAVLRDARDAGEFLRVPLPIWRDATPARTFLDFTFDASATLDEPVDFWIWSPALESWIVGTRLGVVVGVE